MKKIFCVLILVMVALGGCGKSKLSPKSYIGFKIENQPELSDLAQLTETYISPLYQLNALWFYSWNSPAEIKADDLLTACGMENYLKLTQNDEGLYSSRASAEEVETAIYKRFGVNADYLKTSQYYFKDDHTYQLIGGGGGGWDAEAISASKDGNILTIAIGILHPNGGSWKVTAQDQDMGDGFTLSPQGMLTVELKDGYFKYLSYQFLQTDEIPSNETIKDLFAKTIKVLIPYSTEEPSYVLSADFEGKDGTVRTSGIVMDNGRPYQKTGLLYQQVVDKYSKLLTGVALERFLSKYFYDVERVLYVTAQGGKTGYDLINIEITYISQKDGEYLYKVIFDWEQGEDPEHISQESQFCIKNIDGDYKISQIDYFLGENYHDEYYG